MKIMCITNMSIITVTYAIPLFIVVFIQLNALHLDRIIMEWNEISVLNAPDSGLVPWNDQQETGTGYYRKPESVHS